MPTHAVEPGRVSSGTIYRFHPVVRWFMLSIGFITGAYTVYFIFFLIPTLNSDLKLFNLFPADIFFKMTAVIILYISIRTVFTHLTALNAIIIRPDSLEFRFMLRRNIRIPWNRLQKMEIFKVITHYWRVIYTDEKGVKKIFKTSLAFPSIIQILMSVQDHCPEVEMNDLLKQVLAYKRTVAEAPKSE